MESILPAHLHDEIVIKKPKFMETKERRMLKKKKKKKKKRKEKKRKEKKITFEN